MKVVRKRCEDTSLPRVVIVGGGFGGLYAARSLDKLPVRITLVDRRNFHLFQPLLYQVATGGLSPGDIASPIRAVLKRQDNVEVLLSEVVDFNLEANQVVTRDGALDFDFLIMATGMSHSYFGHDEWAGLAPGLKSIEDALEIRRRLLSAFEQAEKCTDPAEQQRWLTFAIIGGGPTGVELAGAMAELARGTLKRDFCHIDPARARILLIEGTERILPAYPPELSRWAAEKLTRLGVEVLTGTLVTSLAVDRIKLSGKHAGEVEAGTILWAAGVQVAPLGRILAKRSRAETDRSGRIKVNPDLSLPACPNVFVIGDLAHVPGPDGQPLPGVAPVAMQQGRYMARVLSARLKGKPCPPFRYRDKGSLAVIGRNAAVAHFSRNNLKGWPAWLAWVFVHIYYLIGFDNKLVVMMRWAFNYLTRKRGARLITGPFPTSTEQEKEIFGALQVVD
ncbi:MAG: NAD(P)/FAD-dependent oxidoreductase [Calditrichaeota bacterium]|nr:MAG: NAD(P)/FAD-dependent oxidoreductase [Calditrichota bacterium]